MGYSNSNFQLGQMLHKEYEATYSAQSSTTTTQSSKNNSAVTILGTLATVLLTIIFLI